MAVYSASSSDSTFRQSEEKLYSGSPFPGFREAAAFLTCSGVTFFTSLRASVVILSSRLACISAMSSASSTQL